MFLYLDGYADAQIEVVITLHECCWCYGHSCEPVKHQFTEKTHTHTHTQRDIIYWVIQAL